MPPPRLMLDGLPRLSGRIVARLKSTAAAVFAAGNTPAELLDANNTVWTNPKRAAEWMELHSLQSSVSEMRDLAGPLNRHAHAAKAWAHAQGMTRTFASGGTGIDFHQVRAAGITWDSGARLVEQLSHAGVTIAAD